MAWWRDAVIYQIYPWSFGDTNGDGLGDLPGVIEHLDYLHWLGVDALWLNPTMPSPNSDWGYDVADYRAVHPVLGTMDDLDRLVAAAGSRDMRILLDLVPNHTSDTHPWFLESLDGRTSPRRDWYVWADPKPDGSAPNNWLSVAGGSAWSLDEASGQFYLHNFLPRQPDLNWWNEEVRDEFDDILRFWFDRGIAGWRIDVCHAVIKDSQLRDNPPATEDDHPLVRRHGQRSVYNMNRPEVHEIIERWRKVGGEYEPERALIGETWLLNLEQMVSFYGTGANELSLAFNFVFAFAPYEAAEMSEIVRRTHELLPPDAWPVWFGSNHDVSRWPTRWAQGHDARIRLGLMMLLTLRGTPVLYYGDEIGQTDTAVPDDLLRDGMGLPGTSGYPGRDAERTPMQWTGAPGAGFTSSAVDPWLPFGEPSRNVAAQKEDTGSVLTLCRALIRVRRASADLVSGGYEERPAPGGVWLYRRGDATLVALNFGDSPAVAATGVGAVRLASLHDRSGEKVESELALAPWEGAIVELAE